MNVLLVSSCASTSNGASKCLVNLAKYLNQADNHVVVLLPKPGSLELELQSLHIPYRIVKHFAKWVVPSNVVYPKGIVQNIKRIGRLSYDRFVARAQVERIIEENHIDIVHINASTTCDAARAAIRKKKKLVWHIREFMNEGLARKFVDLKKSIRLMNRSDCVIAISDAVHQKYQGILSARMVRIYDGVEAQRFYENREENREIFRGETVKIIISGRVEPKKGQLMLLKALSLVKQSGIYNFECHILGPQEHKQYLGEIVTYVNANGLEQCVHLDGYSEDVPQWLRQMDISCTCSDKEAFGLSTVEGMLSGCLVIGANTGATAEIIEDGVSGLLYARDRDGGEGALAERLIWAMRNPEKAREIALNGQERALSEYGSEARHREIVQLYEDLLR